MKSLSERRDELAEKRAMRQCSSGCEHTDKVWQRHLRIGFEAGFDSAIAEVMPHIHEIRIALELAVINSAERKHISEYGLAEGVESVMRNALFNLQKFIGGE